MSKTPIERWAEDIVGGFDRLRAEREYVPDDDEVRDVWRDTMTQTTEYFDALRPAEARAQFDRWLEAHDREVAARALRDAAAEDYRVSLDCPNHCDDATRSRLHARANRLIEREAER